jgi:pyrroloquinoline quinone (PQQ) biosynthesis protein C
MAFFSQLIAETGESRNQLVNVPIVQACLAGQVSYESYMAFLHEAYHHVHHTVPLLQKCREHMPQRLDWLRGPLDEYIEEEQGHGEWILDDIRTCGGDEQAVRHGKPGAATELMVAYAYDTISRGNPVGFFGMVHVLEGTSVALALSAADQIQAHLGLPEKGLTYLRSHGTLDREHTAHFALLMDELKEPEDQAAVTHCANMFYMLYANIFRGLPFQQAEGATA